MNNIQLIILNKLTNLEGMFSGICFLKNIEELKYLNTKEVNNFSYMFDGCSSLSDIKPLQNWNVSNGNNFSYMFLGCSSLSDIKPLQNWNVSNGSNFSGKNHYKIGMFQMEIIFHGCSVIVHLYQI